MYGAFFAVFTIIVLMFFYAFIVVRDPNNFQYENEQSLIKQDE